MIETSSHSSHQSVRSSVYRNDSGSLGFSNSLNYACALRMYDCMETVSVALAFYMCPVFMDGRLALIIVNSLNAAKPSNCDYTVTIM